MAKFAATTSVSVEKSRAEIESTLTKYGATHFAYATEPGRAVIMFVCRARRIRFIVKLPSLMDKAFTHTPKQGFRRDGNAQHAAWEQACRQKWRALLLSIKAKLEAVDAGIAEFEEEFLSYVVDPVTNETMYESVRNHIADRYLGKETGPLLLTGPASV